MNSLPSRTAHGNEITEDKGAISHKVGPGLTKPHRPKQRCMDSSNLVLQEDKQMQTWRVGIIII